MNNNTFNWRVLLIPALLTVFVFVFSQSALWLGDEITYNYSFKDGAQITTLGQVVQSQIEHYKTVNGRTVAHFLCQLYIPFFGKTAFAASNALVWIALLLLMATLCGIKYTEWKKMALLACLMVLGLRTKFTPTCQIGFPWMFALVAAFLLLLQRFGKETTQRPLNGYHLFWAAPFAFIAGWSQEALVIGIGVALAVYVLLYIKKVSWQQWVMLLFFAAGAALLCFSPATLGRTGETHGGTNLLPPVLLSLAKFGFYLRITYLLLAFVLYLRIRKRIRFKELFSRTGFYWIIWVTMLAFNLFIGVYGNRQLFGMEFAAIVIIIKYVQLYLLPEKDKYKPAGHIALAALAVWVAIVAVGNARFLSHQGKILDYIDSSYHSSEDGIVYYDFSAKEVTFKDTYPSDVFTWYALNTLGRSYGNEKKLQVVPRLCEDLKQKTRDNGWEIIAKGTIAIVINRSNVPKGIRVQRSLFFKSLSDFKVKMDEPIYENDNSIVLLVYEKLPLVRHNNIVFEY